MGLFSKSEEHKKAKNLKAEIKDLKKTLINSGAEKNIVEEQMRAFKDALELGGVLRMEYVNSQEHLAIARRTIIQLLEYMAESPQEDVKKSLNELTENLDRVYHECSIRRDDLDFQSTTECLKRMTDTYDGKNTVMLRSELENLHALLEDTSEWNSPNFLALAYYFGHEDRDSVGEMENTYRNARVLTYLNENLMDPLLLEAQQAGCNQKVLDLIQEYIFE